MVSELFGTAVKRSISQDLSVAELLSAVESLARANEPGLVIELYKIWIRHNGANPLLYAIQFNFGVVLSDAQDLEGAKEAFNAAIAINPSFIPPYINLGSVMERLGAADQAIAQWSKAADILGPVTGEAIQHKTAALKQIGRVFETSKLESNAEEILRRSLEINPRQRDVIQHWIALRQSQCKWPAMQSVAGLSVEELIQSISPLSLAVHADDPIFQLANAHHYNQHDVKPLSLKPRTQARPGQQDGSRRLRIGYVSSDLREHAVGFLMSEVFELHDRSHVEVFAYYCGVSASDATQQRFKASADHWRDINSLTDEQAAARIAEDKIDILVDLNGYTKDARLKLFALRPAPIIVNWLGYPGTMGSPYHNYIVADPVTIPAGSEVYFTEKVLRLPCYQPNDRKRVIAPVRPQRAEAGLPEVGFVFCCFNGSQKITRATFHSWMKILARTPDSILWLLTGTEDTNERLRDMAEASGIERNRLIFAPRKANPDHLARYPLADLFLDTAPYGAHTTASDALWMGVPVITVPGQAFASRVCASLVEAAGMGELVCTSIENYVEMAVRLCAKPDELDRLKQKLARNRDTCALFDTPKLVCSLEALFREMWADFRAGRLHRPDLSNLGLLHEIGCELDHEGSTGQAQELSQVYRSKLAERHADWAMENDPRLRHGMAPSGAQSDAGPATAEMAANRPRRARHISTAAGTPASDEVVLQ